MPLPEEFVLDKFFELESLTRSDSDEVQICCFGFGFLQVQVEFSFCRNLTPLLRFHWLI
jgi:hypothetical protein